LTVFDAFGKAFIVDATTVN